MQRYQHTVAGEARCKGVGLHSGREVELSIKPAPPNHGIRFSRIDLPNRPTICAIFKNVVDTSLATVIGGEGAIVSTIEHLMSSFAGLGVDNALVEINSYELPILDGSAAPFARMITEAGLKEQDSPRYYFMVRQPIQLAENGRSVTIYPDEQARVTCNIDFPHPAMGKQTVSITLSGNAFEEDICRARTFGFLHELEFMKQCGLAKGGTLDNAIVLDEEKVINEEGLRFEDEFARHKLLDCLGDFSLLGIPILGHIVTHKSGHAFNHAFLEKFFQEKDCWETTTLIAREKAVMQA
ncbi:UDP-3-O-acyl-N-acetylglucosamine deacetylase [Desulfatibacillum alkenivorans]|jgi:UDP-3-O-[3-hydroxymyristoyl] N-acetylglucosamine deacetylase|uniref:UDP-3-O-acyl-N-acetylglucosamine deacetylase n=1 Tax=Desulfatibacillum alkenivorans TaxID=259354 RepID=UPI0009359153|nr:UDP-3-O-acyl-N-acetylglucosamine deacetylase [Desulfatibacillum alkenivorans]